MMAPPGSSSMPFGDDGPLSQGAREGLDWFSMATEASGGGTPELGFFLEVLGYIRGVGVRNKAGGSPGCPRGRGRAPHPRRHPGTLLAQFFYFMAFFWSKNKLRQVSGQLDSVWFSFSAILKNKGKT